LHINYKYVLTLPSTQVTCERSFSQLKNIKTRICSQLTDSKLEAFMMMGVEKEKLASLGHDFFFFFTFLNRELRVEPMQVISPLSTHRLL
jgi:hypothetical protein